MSNSEYILNNSVNRSIEDFYEITSKCLGKGTYGDVMLGNIKDASSQRAIKIIKKSKVKNIERFRTEINIMKAIDHPNILRLYEAFEDKTNVYLVLE